MRWVKLLLILVVVFLVVAGGGVLFLLTLDLNNYKPQIEVLAQRWTGRTLELNGRVDLDLGTITTLELTDATFGNAEWATAQYMARLKRAKVVVDLRSLIDGPIVVERFELEDAELNLESTEEGKNNWTFGATDEQDEQIDRDDRDDDDWVPLIVRHAEAREFVLTQIVPAFERPIVIRAQTLTQTQREDGLLDIDIVGERNDRELSLSGTYGPMRSLLDARDLQLEFAAAVDTVNIEAKGVVDDLLLPRRPTFELRISGPATGEVSDLLGLPTASGRELDLEISVRPDDDGITAKIAGGVGDFTTDINARANELLSFDEFSLDAFVAGPNLSNLLGLFGIEGAPSGPYELAGNVVRKAERLDIDTARLSIGDAVFELSGQIDNIRNLDGGSISLKVRGNDVERFRELVGIPGAATGPFQISANLNAGEAGKEVLDAYLQTNIAHLKIDGTIVGEAPDFLGTRFAFEGSGNDLTEFTDQYDIPNVIAEPFMIRGAVELGEQRLVTTEAVRIEVGQDAVTLDGTLGYEPLVRHTDIRFTAIGGSLAEFAAMAGFDEGVPETEFDIGGRISVASGGYDVRGLDARVGSGRLTLDGMISRADDFRGSRATFSASGPALNDLFADTPTLDFAEGPFEISGTAEYLADAIRLQEIALMLEGATANLDANVELPLSTASGEFDFRAEGPNLRAVMPLSAPWTAPDAPFALAATGRLDDGLWVFDKLVAKLATATVTGTGTVNPPPDWSQTSLAVDANIPNFAELGLLNERPLPSTNATLNVGLSGSPDSIAIDPIEGVLGKGDIDAHLHIALDEAVPDIELRLVSDVLDLALLGSGMDEPESEADATNDSEPAGDGRLIPDQPLPLDDLKKLNAVIDIDAATVLFRGVDYEDFVVDGELRDGRLVVERISAASPAGSINTSFSLIPTADSANVSALLNGAGIYVGLGPERTPEEIANSPKFDVQLELDSSGLTYREVAAGLTGSALVTAYGGQLPNTGTRLLFGNFIGEVLNAVNPFYEQEPYTQIDCILVMVEFNDGIVAGDPNLVTQTDKLVIAASGQVDLNTEAVDLGFRTSPRSRLSISAAEFINPFVRIRGTLAEPRLTMDATSAAVTGGAAIATVGLSLLATAVWDRLARADDPCAAALEETEDNTEERKKFLGIF